MKLFRLSALSILLVSVLLEPLSAAPARFATPAIALNRVEAQSVCHHYRWSSRRHCTPARVLGFYNRTPRLHYPSRYYADRPHYYYEQRNFYWRSMYDRHRWFYGPYRYGWPYRYWY
jgi:hypothetical protein